MKLSNELNNTLVVLSDELVTYFVLAYLVRCGEKSVTMRFLGPLVKSGLTSEYQVFDVIGDEKIANTYGMVYKVHSFEEADRLVDIDEDIRYFSPLTTVDKRVKELSSINIGDNLIFRIYDKEKCSYSIPERVRVDGIDGLTFTLYSYINKEDREEVLIDSDNMIKYLVSIG